MEQGVPEEAVTCYCRALDICRAVGSRYEEAKILVNLGNVGYFQGRVAHALRHYDEAIDVFTGIGERRGEAFVRANAATVRHTVLGDDEAAERDAKAALAFYAQVGDRAGEGQCMDTLGGIALRRGDLDAARQQWTAALAAMRDAGDRWGEISIHRSLVELALAEESGETALTHLDEATALCQELDLADRATILRADRAHVLLTLGNSPSALVETTQAMAQLKPGVEQGYLVPFVHHQALAAAGQPERAREAIEQAHALLLDALKDLSPDQQEMSLARVPEHRAIVAAWEATRSQQRVCCLPAASAPTGRPLRDDEWVQVTWTVTAPEDDRISGKVARRRHRLLRLLAEAESQAAAPTVSALASALGASERTIKRDLAALREAGHDVQTRGARS